MNCVLNNTRMDQGGKDVKNIAGFSTCAFFLVCDVWLWNWVLETSVKFAKCDVTSSSRL